LIVITLTVLSLNTFGQVTNVTHAGNAGEYVGWDGSTPIDLDIVHSNVGYNINFWTNNGTGINRNMVIDQNGYVGIGSTVIPPSHQLDVAGEISICSPNKYYMICNSTVLHNYGGNNFFGGDFSGNFTLSGTGNTAVGWFSGNNLTSGNGNSFYGYMSGTAPSFSGNNNCFFGNQAGQTNTSGSANVFISAAAGNYNTELAFSMSSGWIF